MDLPSATSELIILRDAADSELRRRFAAIFKRHRALAFLQRKDRVFEEHWTPETAASRYEFERHEIKDGRITLSGVEQAEPFSYRISIWFPLAVADDEAAIEAHFAQQREVLLRTRPKPKLDKKAASRRSKRG